MRLLRWSDIDLDKKTARWRGENDKIGFEHVTPLTAKALKALKRVWKERPMIGEAWLFPAPEGRIPTRVTASDAGLVAAR